MTETNKKITPEKIRSKLNESIATAVTMHKEECGSEEKNFSRSRKLDMETLIKFLIFIKGGSIQKELNDAGIDVWKSAFSQSRKKIFGTDMENVLEDFNQRCKAMDTKTYKGYRILAVDGTAINIARNPESNTYIQTKSDRRGYNQLHANMMYDVLNQVYLHCTVNTDEIGGLLFMLEWFDYAPNTIIITDRGYESYNTFACLFEKGIHFLIRVKQKNSAMREIRHLPMEELDKDISFVITTTQTNADKANNYIYVQQTKKDKQRTRWNFYSPYPMTLRIVRVLLDNGEYETLATNLPRDIFTAEDIKELYSQRWQIELSFRNAKYTGVALTRLHGKSEEFAQQEIFASMVFSNFCNRIINQIIIENDDTKMHEYKVNRKMAVDFCREFYQKKISSKQLIEKITKYTEPVRKGRKSERNIKAKSFTGFNYRIT